MKRQIYMRKLQTLILCFCFYSKSILQEIDKQASEQVLALFAAIDASLYEDVRHQDAEMEQECRDWASRCVYQGWLHVFFRQ